MIISFQEPIFRILEIQLHFSQLLVWLGYVWLLVDFIDPHICIQHDKRFRYISEIVQLNLLQDVAVAFAITFGYVARRIRL